MPYPTVVVTSSALTTSNDVLMTATPADGIENRRYPRRFYNFNMIINNPFTIAEYNARLTLTDNSSTNVYSLIDRLNKPVTAVELQGYASTRRCIACQFDSVYNTIRVLSCMCPADRYMNEWVDPTSSKDPIETILKADNTDGD